MIFHEIGYPPHATQRRSVTHVNCKHHNHGLNGGSLRRQRPNVPKNSFRSHQPAPPKIKGRLESKVPRRCPLSLLSKYQKLITSRQQIPPEMIPCTWPTVHQRAFPSGMKRPKIHKKMGNKVILQHKSNQLRHKASSRRPPSKAIMPIIPKLKKIPVLRKFKPHSRPGLPPRKQQQISPNKRRPRPTNAISRKSKNRLLIPPKMKNRVVPKTPGQKRYPSPPPLPLPNKKRPTPLQNLFRHKPVVPKTRKNHNAKFSGRGLPPPGSFIKRRPTALKALAHNRQSAKMKNKIMPKVRKQHPSSIPSNKRPILMQKSKSHQPIMPKLRRNFKTKVFAGQHPPLLISHRKKRPHYLKNLKKDPSIPPKVKNGIKPVIYGKYPVPSVPFAKRKLTAIKKSGNHKPVVPIVRSNLKAKVPRQGPPPQGKHTVFRNSKKHPIPPKIKNQILGKRPPSVPSNKRVPILIQKSRSHQPVVSPKVRKSFTMKVPAQGLPSLFSRKRKPTILGNSRTKIFGRHPTSAIPSNKRRPKTRSRQLVISKMRNDYKAKIAGQHLHPPVSCKNA